MSTQNVPIYDAKGGETGEIAIPSVFSTKYRPDLIKRAVFAEQSLEYQRQGRSLRAGRMGSQLSWGPGRGVSRVPRTKGSQTHHGSRGAFINMARGGKLAHPPRAAKKIVERINKKEHRFAIMSAIATTMDRDLAILRGHRITEDLMMPLVIGEDVAALGKTKEVSQFLLDIGLEDELDKLIKHGKYVRAGKGKMRGRRYRRKVGPLIVTPSSSPLYLSARNITGITTRTLQELKAQDMAPGTQPGRLTIYTEDVIREMNSHFM